MFDDQRKIENQFTKDFPFPLKFHVLFPTLQWLHSYDSSFEVEFETDRQTEVKKLAHVVAHVACASLALAAMFGLRAHSEKCGAFYPRLVDVHHPSSSSTRSKCSRGPVFTVCRARFHSRPRERRTILLASTDKRIPLISSFVFLSYF